MNRIWIVNLFLVIVASPHAAAELRIASVFSDHMVLQRDAEIRVWGHATANQPVVVSLGEQSARITADESGRWLATLRPMPARSVAMVLKVVAGNESIEVKDILIGDVWFCSGQSNMQMLLKEAKGGEAYADAAAGEPNIRLLWVPKAFSDKVENKQGGVWKPLSKETAMEFSAVGLSFGVSLRRVPAMKDVPIGLIDSSFGATVVEGWIPQQELSKFDAKDIGNSMFGGPTHHFNAMIAPFAPMAMRGVIWYQGEGNAGRPATYADFLNTMIQSWRDRFRQKELPFLIIELPAFANRFGPFYFTWLREQQVRVAEGDKHVALVPTYDTHDGSDLHPPEKIIIGERAALAARKLVYAEDVAASGPVVQAVEFREGSIVIRFAANADRLATRDGSTEVSGFTVAGDDNVFTAVPAKISGKDTVVLDDSSIDHPRNVRFAWAGVPVTNLINNANLPARPFRTDRLPADDGPVEQ